MLKPIWLSHRSRRIKIASCLDSWILIPGAFLSSILGCGGIGLERKIWSPPRENFNMNQHEVWIYAEPRRNSLLPAAVRGWGRSLGARGLCSVPRRDLFVPTLE